MINWNTKRIKEWIVVSTVIWLIPLLYSVMTSDITVRRISHVDIIGITMLIVMLLAVFAALLLFAIYLAKVLIMKQVDSSKGFIDKLTLITGMLSFLMALWIMFAAYHKFV